MERLYFQYIDILNRRGQLIGTHGGRGVRRRCGTLFLPSYTRIMHVEQEVSLFRGVQY